MNPKAFSSKIEGRYKRKPVAAIYVRTTTKGSRRQLNKELKCRAYCDEQGWHVAEDLVVSELASPTTLDRKGLQQILKAASDRLFDILVIYEFGELSKNSAQSNYIIGELAKHSIAIAIVNDLTIEQMFARIEKLPDDLKHKLKSEMANLVLTAAHRQN